MQHFLDKPFTQKREGLEASRQESLVMPFSLDLVICSVIVCAALYFNLYRLGMPSIWFDEALSVERARQSLPVLWKIVFTTQPNMALYYLVLHHWLQFVGLFGWLPTEAVVRFPSAIFAALSAVIIYLFGRRFMGRTAGLVSAGLYVINPLQLIYAQQARSYSLQLLLLCCSWYALLAAQTDKRQKRWWLCYAIMAILAVYTHLFSLLVLFAQIITYCCLAVLPTVWRESVRHRYLFFMASMAGIFLALLPILLVARHGGKTGWLPIPQVHDILYILISIAGGSKIYLLTMSLAGTFGIVSILLAKTYRRRQLSNQNLESRLQRSSISSAIVMRFLDMERIQYSCPVIPAMLCWFIIPLVVSFAVSQGSTRLFSSRYLVVIVPPLLYLVAIGIEVLSRQRGRIVRIGLVAALFYTATSPVPFYYQNAQVENWKEGTFWLQSHYRTGDGIVCYDNAQGCQLDIEYYLRVYPRGVTFPTDSPGSFPWVGYDLTNQIQADTKQAADPTTLAAYGALHPRLFFITARLANDKNVAHAEMALHWLDSHYRLLDQIVTHTATIRLYQTEEDPCYACAFPSPIGKNSISF